MSSGQVRSLTHLRNGNDKTPLGDIMGIRQTLRATANYQQDHSCARNTLAYTDLKGWHDSCVPSSPFGLGAGRDWLCHSPHPISGWASLLAEPTDAHSSFPGLSRGPSGQMPWLRHLKCGKPSGAPDSEPGPRGAEEDNPEAPKPSEGSVSQRAGWQSRLHVLLEGGKP